MNQIECGNCIYYKEQPIDPNCNLVTDELTRISKSPRLPLGICQRYTQLSGETLQTGKFWGPLDVHVINETPHETTYILLNEECFEAKAKAK